MKLAIFGLTAVLAKPKCLTCTSEFDHLGNPLPFSDPGCFDEDPISENYSQECADETSVCILDIEVDWHPDGHQSVHLQRGCGDAEDIIQDASHCQGNYNIVPTPLTLYKDCNDFCDPATDGDNCNGYSLYDKVVNYHDSGEGAVENCHSCSFKDVNGNVNGDTKCVEGSSSIQKKQCPTYANAACFTAASWADNVINGDLQVFEQDHRGCSAFTFFTFDSDCQSGTNGDSGHFAECKYTCGEDNCNTNKLAKRKTCITCEGTRFSDNSTVGIGDDNCWDLVGAINQVECPFEDDVCTTDLEIDWLPRGMQQATIKRGCHRKRADESSWFCNNSPDPQADFRYRDCQTFCGDSLCNTDLEFISSLFSSENPQDMCHTCRYHENNDGTVEGRPACKDEPDTPTMCPTYANNGCYVGSNVHFDDGQAREDVFRGCSSFDQSESPYCTVNDLVDSSGNVAVFGVCKEFCYGMTNCNKNAHIQPDLPLDGIWSTCQVCSIVVDQENRTMGIGDEGCVDGDPMYNKLCDDPMDFCVTDLEVDWFPRGFHTYRIQRGCSANRAYEKCLEGSSSLMQYKDCQVDCNPHLVGNSCNMGLEGIADKFEDKEGVTQCYMCNYTEHADGSVEGQESCGDEVSEGGNIRSIACPRYATKSCYHAASFHTDYANDDAEFTDDYRGCSPFEEKRDQYCELTQVSGLDHLNCRETCTENDCNTAKIKKRPQCYSCSALRDSNGEPIGVGDDACFERLNSGHLIDCASDEDYCIDEIKVDWFPKGEQQTQIRRGCASTTYTGPCTEGSTDRIKYKDCYNTCAGDACNNDLTVGDKFIGSYKEESCYACRFVEHDNGDLEGNKNCGKTGQGQSMDCPNYASAGCYTGAAAHNVLGNRIDEVYKGCSTFEITTNGGLEQVNATLPNDDGEDSAYAITKTTCRGKNCNSKHVPPANPEDPTPIEGNFCQVCQVTVDQFNRTVGVGQDACWDGSDQYLVNCGTTKYCLTDLEIDWFAKGHFEYRLRRGCSSEEAPVECYDGASSMIQYKDCSVSCDPEIDGVGCNTGLIPVAEKFSEKNVAQCFQCEFVQELDGTINGLPTCGQLIVGGNTNQIPQLNCPLYADAACFWAASFHKDLTGSEAEMEDDHRGCSPFALNRHDQCEPRDLNGVQHINCKDTCQSNNCNVDRVVKTLQCHSCSAIQDSQGNMVGLGDDRCFYYPESTDLVDCPIGTDFCSTEMLVDWYALGKQEVTIRRGCSQKENPIECQSGQSDRIRYKDCFEDCTEMGCNIGLKVAQKFNDGYDQKTCYSCQYVEADDGSVSGNSKCPDSPTDEMIMDCPAWATNGCYVGTAVHNTGTRKEEVYKGCSSFYIGETTEFFNDTLPNGIEYNLAKQTCRGENCNTGHDLPTEPDEQNDCFQCTIQKDHLGNTIGTASESCWKNPSIQLLNPCPEDKVCITEMLVDWFPKGEQVVTLQRKCGDRPVTPGGNKCVEENFNTYMWKDCLEYCDGHACNNGFDEVEELFDQGNDLECYSCKYARRFDGSILDGSNEKCSLADVEGQIETVQCPKYANAACYSASTWDTATREENEDYKGCSTFRLSEDETYCQELEINGESYTSCKTTCDGKNCNNETEEKSLSCYVCDVTIDSQNNTLGYGDYSCTTDRPSGANIQQCRGNEKFCVVDIEVDWYLFGKQTTRFRRSCSQFAAPAECYTQVTSEGMFYLKDCSTSCDESDCNTELTPAAQKFATGKQDACYACSYLEKDNGDIDGNIYCPEEPDKVDDSSIPCPAYADAACFTGTNAHFTTEGVVTEEVFKGCSTFEITDEPIKCNLVYNQTVDEQFVEYGVCKQTCSGKNCNLDHTRPCVPTAGDDCGYPDGPNNPDGPSGAATLISSIVMLIFALVL